MVAIHRPVQQLHALNLHGADNRFDTLGVAALREIRNALNDWSARHRRASNLSKAWKLATAWKLAPPERWSHASGRPGPSSPGTVPSLTAKMCIPLGFGRWH